METRILSRFRAALRLISPDDITPMGKRMLEKILDEEEREIRDGSRTRGKLAEVSENQGIVVPDEQDGQHGVGDGRIQGREQIVGASRQIQENGERAKDEG